ncbi:uncharacterized protein MONBRDRAFT_31081 [Monosiga brevicollis MX1]|uniref:Uncharacterized protein n=1 Tax=Monosiga brevicollis TaxID=81824 RepID=A9UNL5_MONBE|nr:uncharacterized protein MONBRDRAFT_31081 [Monosiga brevicollis MX1]EDQ92719.1 predicted protein [Monosiga brevicollis MX1]|eukprot:XP_001742481.1 hypothetical protein [Monosiga brevicollis MX1]
MPELAQSLTPDQLEDILARACFACGPADGSAVPEVSYRLADGTIIRLNEAIRTNVADVLFEDDEFGDGLVTGILTALQACPVDVRRELAKNLVVVGGHAHLRGLRYRLLQSLPHTLRSISESANDHVEKGPQRFRVRLAFDMQYTSPLYTMASTVEKIKMELAEELSTALWRDAMVEQPSPESLVLTVETLEPVKTDGMKGKIISGKTTLVMSEAACEPAPSDEARAFAIHDVPVQSNCVFWTAAAVFAALPGNEKYFLSPSKYQKDGTLPDWASIVEQELVDPMRATTTTTTTSFLAGTPGAGARSVLKTTTLRRSLQTTVETTHRLSSGPRATGPDSAVASTPAPRSGSGNPPTASECLAGYFRMRLLFQHPISTPSCKLLPAYVNEQETFIEVLRCELMSALKPIFQMRGKEDTLLLFLKQKC